MFVEEIRIINFQKHEKIRIVFDPITTITGDTDTGKSSILRALRWLCLNQPQGKAFIRNGEKESKVSAKIEGKIASRIRGSSNEYKLCGKTYKSFSGNVPDELEDFFRLSEDNFLDQHDSAFWLSLSPVEASRKLNEVVDLEIIDKALQKSTRAFRETSRRVADSLERLTENKEVLQKLSWVPSMEVSFSSLKVIKEELKGLEKERERLKNVCDSLEVKDKDRESLLAWEESVTELVCVCDDLLKAESKRDSLRFFAERLKNLERMLRTDVPKDDVFSEIVSIKIYLNNHEPKRRRLDNLSTVLGERVKERKAADSSLDEISAKLSKHKRCPVCGGELS